MKGYWHLELNMTFESAEINNAAIEQSTIENISQMRRYAALVQDTKPELTDYVERVVKELHDFLNKMDSIANSGSEHITSLEDKEQSSEQRELIAALQEFVTACENSGATDSLQALLHDDAGLHARINGWAARQIKVGLGTFS
jgi:hypothetical protein